MRILHITPHYHPAIGGAEIYTKEISERLTRRGHEVTVLTLDDSGGPPQNGHRFPAADEINQVQLRRFKPTGRLQGLVGGALGMRGAGRLFSRAMSIDKIQMLAHSPYGLRAFHISVRDNPDVVAVINWYGGSLAYQTCLARRIRGFALIAVPLFHTECDWSQGALYAQMLAQCDAVVAMTEHEKTFIEQRSGDGNAHVVGVGVNPAAFARADENQIRTRYGIGDVPLVGYVGRMVASKGVVTLIEAMQKVWRTDPTVRLLLAGSGLPTGSHCQEEVAQALARLSAVEQSRIIGIDGFNDDEKASIFAALDVFAMPSTAESFGIAYLEAWICKKALIGARIASTACVIEDGVDGVLVTPENGDDLAQAILRLLSDRVTRERMGQAGYRKTIARFTWDRITDRVEHIYHEARTRCRSGFRRRATISARAAYPTKSRLT